MEIEFWSSEPLHTDPKATWRLLGSVRITENNAIETMNRETRRAAYAGQCEVIAVLVEGLQRLPLMGHHYTASGHVAEARRMTLANLYEIKFP